MLDLTKLMATAQKQNWALAALDCAMDTSTPTGEAMAAIMATFAQLERRLISQRMKEGMAAKNAAGARTRRLAARDRDSLSGDSVLTVQGGQRWYAATVRGVLLRTS